MADKVSGVEASAVNVLKRAVELDEGGRCQEAMVCYEQGISLLMTVLKTFTDEAKRKKYRERISSYMERAEKLKVLVKEQAKNTKHHEQIHIVNDSIGHGYESLFLQCLDDQLTSVEVDDAYIRTNNQIHNFVRFCELCVKSKSPIKTIVLNTGVGDKEPQQRQNLDQLAVSLRQNGITLNVNYSHTLHDREIRFNNGWVVQIGRGLDYFKHFNHFTIGSLDLDLRKCHETNVDIYYSNVTSLPS